MLLTQTEISWCGEHHENFVPVDLQPVTIWVDRDEDAINQIKQLATALLGQLDEANAFEKEMK